MSSGKFRIALNLSQINWIIENSQQDMPELHRQLMILKTKADLGYTKPSYEIKPAKEKTQKEIPIQIKYKAALAFLEKGEEIPEDLMPAYTEYRYLNDLMSPDESKNYELEAGF